MKKKEYYHNYPLNENTGGILLLLAVALAVVLYFAFTDKVKEDTEEHHKIELSTGKSKL